MLFLDVCVVFCDVVLRDVVLRVAAHPSLTLGNNQVNLLLRSLNRDVPRGTFRAARAEAMLALIMPSREKCRAVHSSAQLNPARAS